MAEEVKKKRLVKNPETFRERALKATEARDKPTRSRRIRNLSGKLVSPVVRPIGNVGSKAGTLKPVRITGSIFRFISVVLFPKYLRNSWKELRLVAWPSRKQSFRLTFAVLSFAIVFGAAIAIVDYGLDKLFRDILLK